MSYDFIAEQRASEARRTAAEALEVANKQATESHSIATAHSPLIVLQPFGLEDVSVGAWYQFKHKTILSEKAWGKISVKRADILNLAEYQDDDGKTYVALKISEYANVVDQDGDDIDLLFIPGKLEAVTETINQTR